jgi:16S rRNA (adenine1518-N6/adenine1519-N6)-dimethyltransferase
MARLVETADLTGGETVLEVGGGTGSLTEQLASRAARVVVVEVDHGMVRLLRGRLAEKDNVSLIAGDVLAGKHKLSPDVLAALGEQAHLTANLPYNIATPLISLCLQSSWRAARGLGGCRFERLTFTVQREVADRFAAEPGGKIYGPVSVLVSLLSRLQMGPIVPASAFWPRPKVASRIVRLDFDDAAAANVNDAGTLTDVVAAAFAQRRKQMGSLLRRPNLPWPADAIAAAFTQADIDPTCRAETIAPQQYLALANSLSQQGGPSSRR